jgi:hypothetical protein
MPLTFFVRVKGCHSLPLPFGCKSRSNHFGQRIRAARHIRLCQKAVSARVAPVKEKNRFIMVKAYSKSRIRANGGKELEETTARPEVFAVACCKRFSVRPLSLVGSPNSGKKAPVLKRSRKFCGFVGPG